MDFADCVVEAALAGTFLGAVGSTTTVGALVFSLGLGCGVVAAADAGFTFAATGALVATATELAGGVAGFGAMATDTGRRSLELALLALRRALTQPTTLRAVRQRVEQQLGAQQRSQRVARRCLPSACRRHREAARANPETRRRERSLPRRSRCESSRSPSRAREFRLSRRTSGASPRRSCSATRKPRRGPDSPNISRRQCPTPMQAEPTQERGHCKND